MGNVTRRPDGRWRARYRDPGGKERARHFTRRADALRWLAEVETTKTRGDWVDPQLARVTIAEWSQTWLATKATLKPKTRIAYESVLRVWILPRWGGTPIDGVTHSAVVKWQAEVLTQVGAARTRHAVDALGQLLELAVLDNRLPRNVVRGVQRPRMPQGQQRFLTHDEVHRLARACEPPFDLLVLLLAYTGLRFGEAAGLQVHDVDIGRRRISVKRALVEANGVLVEGTPKTHQRRTVPIPAFLAERLGTHVQGMVGSDPLFTSLRGGPLRNSNFRSYVFDAAVESAGLAPLTPHDLRDTAASLAVSAGATVKAVQRMLGHASAAMTLDVYSGLFDSELDDVAERLDSAASTTAVVRDHRGSPRRR
jgi:integrase